MKRRFGALLLSAFILFAVVVVSIASNTMHAARVTGLGPGDVPGEPPQGALPGGASAWWEGGTTDPAEVVEVMVQLEEPPSAEVYASLRSSERGHDPHAARAAQEHMRHLQRVQEQVAAALTGPTLEAKITVRTQRLYNGIAVQVAAGKLDAIRKLPGVKAVHPLTPRAPATGSTVPFLLGTRSLQTFGATGQGVHIAVIDVGIDYFHTHFGGSGLAADYTGNDATRVGDRVGFPTEKIPFGTDLVGDRFDFGSATAADRVPAPDADPFSAINHGTMIAGIAAGLGVTLNGQTYVGPYDANLVAVQFLVDPGLAPGARIWPIKVFGAQGGLTSPAIVVRALEFAVDRNGDGDFSDGADVINVSLSDLHGSPDDPDVIAAGNAVLLGVPVVGSVGNTGDTYNTTGGPASHPDAISVGATFDNGVTLQIVDITSPADIAGPFRATFSVFGPSLPPNGVSGEVALTAPTNGCGTLTNASALAGRVALIADGGCGVIEKVLNAQRAGAIAALIASNAATAPFGAPNLGPRVTIPSFVIPAGTAQQIQQRSPGVFVSLRPDNQEELRQLADTLGDYSGRGTPGNVIKPDITAPGMNVHSGLAGSGFDGGYVSGTSMSAAHVSGVIALMLQRDPNLTPLEIKALLTNTASRVSSGANAAPPFYGPGRVGAGRVNLAGGNPTASFVSAADGRAFVSFGFNEVVGTQSFLRQVYAINRGTAAQSYNVAYDAATDMPGVNVVVPATLSVPANGVVTFLVQTNADAAQMKHARDATDTATVAGNPRHWETYESGYITFTPAAGGAPLRMPVHGIFRPAAALQTLPAALNLTAATGQFDLRFFGPEVRGGTSFPLDWNSAMTPFESPGPSPNDAATTGDSNKADLKYLGVHSDFGTVNNLANSRIYFAVATHSDWRTPNEVDFRVGIDTNRDGTDDFVLFNGSVANAHGAPSDVFASFLRNATTGAITTEGNLNAFSAQQADTALYRNHVLFLPVRAASLGLTDANSRFNWQVSSFLRGGRADQSRRVSYDPRQGGFNFGSNITHFVFNNTSLPVTYNRANLTANGTRGALLLHHLNRFDQRAVFLPIP